MFNLLKSKSEIAVSEPKSSGKYPAVVEEIHNEFFTAGDKILAEALKVLGESAGRDIKQGERLKKLGFTNSKLVTQFEKSQVTKEVADLIMYYRKNYRNNKFITKEQVISICKKYGLILGEVSAYTGFIPEVKISDIERFKVKNNDVERIILSQSTYPNKNGIISEDNGQLALSLPSIYKKVVKSLGLKICAPQKDMIIHSYQTVSNYEIKEIPDPIVLQPVKGGYLIVCAWGDEASDPIIVNETMN